MDNERDALEREKGRVQELRSSDLLCRDCSIYPPCIGDENTCVKCMRKTIDKYMEALISIAAQDSGEPLSTKKADCLAAIAQLALRET